VACRSCVYTHMCRRARVWSVSHGCTEIYIGKLVCGLSICIDRHMCRRARVWPVGHVYTHICVGGLVCGLSVTGVQTYM